MVSANGTGVIVSNSYCKDNLVYNGSEQVLTKDAGTGFSFSNNKRKNAGSQTVTAKLDAGYMWGDGTTADKTFECSIAKKDAIITIEPSSVEIKKGTSTKFSYTYDGDGSLSCSRSTSVVDDCSVNTTDKTVEVKGLSSGTSVITLKAAAGTNSVFGSTNGDLKRGLEFGVQEYKEIDLYCKQRGIIWFASCWDENSVDFMEEFNIPCYNISFPNDQY